MVGRSPKASAKAQAANSIVNPVYTYPHTPDQASAGSITSVLVYTGDDIPGKLPKQGLHS